MNKTTTRLLTFFGLLFLMIFIKPALAGEAEKFRFIVMSDMFFGATSPEEYQSAVREMKKYKPDFVLFLGDMVDTVGDKATKNRNKALREAYENEVKLSPPEVEALWREFDRITGELGVPVYDIPGERCIPPNNLGVTEKEFLKRYKKRYYTFKYKNNLFICLDSEYRNQINLPVRDLIEGEQKEFLEKIISDVSKYDHVFLAIHKCAWDTSPTQLNRWFGNIHSLINGKVRVVFGSEGFYPFDIRNIDEVTYVTSGGALFSPHRGEENSFRHFLIVDVDKEKVSIKVVPLEPVPAEYLLGFERETFIRPATGLVPPVRDDILQIPRVVKTLKIKPGMQIVDIGAGRGIFTFPFARALKGTGTVFATDVELAMLEKIAGGAKKNKYKNIVTVEVKSETVDPFYKKHVFDIIFMCSLYEALLDKESFVRELRSSLKPETGRLYIIAFKPAPDFIKEEFVDFKEVVKILQSKDKNFPVFKRLSKDNQQFVKNWRGEEVPLKIQIKIVNDFNKMLNDKTLWNDFLGYLSEEDVAGFFVMFRQYIYPADFRLAKELIVDLDAGGVFNEAKPALSEREQKDLRRLNRILLMSIFQTQRLYDIHDLDLAIFPEKKSIIATLERAGYRLEKEYDFLTQHYFLEFKRAD